MYICVYNRKRVEYMFTQQYAQYPLYIYTSVYNICEYSYVYIYMYRDYAF